MADEIKTGTILTMGFAEEGTMSERNGDKARFGREHWRKTLRRKCTRELRKVLETKLPIATSPVPEDEPTAAR